MERVLLLLFLLSILTVNSQSNLWKEVSKSRLKSKDKKVRPSKYKVYRLDLQLLKEELEKAPKQRENINFSTVILNFPDENGTLKKYKIAEASVMDVQLQENHPTIKSYIGKSIDNSNSIIRFSISPYTGFNGIILNNSVPPTLIERDGNYYQVFSQKDSPLTETPFECGVIDEVEYGNNKSSSKKKVLINGQLRTYRLALTTTGEYSQRVLNGLNISNVSSDSIKKNAILGHLNSTMINVNAVFERDLATTMRLVTNNTDIIFLDAATDNLNNSASTESLDKNQRVCDSIIGSSNYDIGFSLFLGYQGIANIGSVCSSSAQAVGGNIFSGGYKTILHEMGHQFGATHTFNNIVDVIHAENGVEIGFGRTIMSYENSGNLFFHAFNVSEMRDFTQNIGCASITNTGDTPPSVNAGSDFTIPKSTPFLLEGIATDSDSSNLTYTWEQINPEKTTSTPNSEATKGPAFVWLQPSTSTKRYMPNINTIISGKTENTWEVVPSVSRELNFIFLVRDNDTRGGETGADQMKVTVDGNSGPFLITSNNSPTIWRFGETQTLTWDVASTNSGAVNTPTVDILFSIDGGITYPTALASNVSNDGSYSFTIPTGIATTQGRFMIKGHNNIFLDINNADIIVQKKQLNINGFALTDTINLYPNPVTNILYIKNTNNIKIQQVKIFNILGKLIYDKRNKNNQIYFSDFSKAVYIIKLIDKEGRYTIKKVLKE